MELDDEEIMALANCDETVAPEMISLVSGQKTIYHHQQQKEVPYPIEQYLAGLLSTIDKG